jgi:hypothetical protein
VFILEYQKDTSIKDKKPTPSQETNKNTQLPVLIRSSIKNKKKPISKVNLLKSGSFLK